MLPDTEELLTTCTRPNSRVNGMCLLLEMELPPFTNQHHRLFCVGTEHCVCVLALCVRASMFGQCVWPAWCSCVVALSGGAAVLVVRSHVRSVITSFASGESAKHAT